MTNLKEKSNEELLNIILELENKLATKKLGLVWDREREPEQVVQECINNIPLFKKTDFEVVTSSLNDNLLLVGDNYHSLLLLNYTHANSIDVIYIDPPYNRGKDDFKYNDKFVDIEDTYKHSKWLNFMSKRLELAKKLLTTDGLIFISIDDNEMFELKLLCDQVFGDNNFVSCLPRVTKKSGKQHSEDIGKNHDYVLVYAKQYNSSIIGKFDGTDESYQYEDEYVLTRGKYKLNQTLDYDSLYYNKAMDFELAIEEDRFVPGGSLEKHNDRHNGQFNKMDWVWRWSRAKFDFGLKNGFVVVKRGGDRPRIYTKTYANATISKKANKYFVEQKVREKNLTSLEFVENKYSNDNATKDLAEIIGKNLFEYTKPIDLICKLLQLVNKEDALVLDFFAGSGTTGHAVLKLNKEDGQNRRFILCTNNENDIAYNICFKRLEKAIKGFVSLANGDEIEPLGSNLKVFETVFLPVEKVDTINDDIRQKIVENITEVIMIKDSCFLEISSNEYYKILSSRDEKRKIAIYFNENMDGFEEMIEKLEKERATVYMFSYEKNSTLETEYGDRKIDIESLPEPFVSTLKSNMVR
jgi:adenine-specific DNA-methyltransferase